jgi:hypothetical protein
MLLAMTVDTATQKLREFLTLSISLPAMWDSRNPANPRAHPRQQRARAGRCATPDRAGRPPPTTGEGGWRVAGGGLRGAMTLAGDLTLSS